MNGIQANDELALKYLESALKYNKFDQYIFSMPIYDLTVRDGYGNMVHSPKHVMTAIYNKQRADNTIDMGQLINTTVTETLNQYKYHPCIINLLENLEYHMQIEKNQNTQVNIDSAKLLDVVKEHLTRNQDVYKIATQRHGNLGLWPQIELFDVRMQQSTGRKII